MLATAGHASLPPYDSKGRLVNNLRDCCEGWSGTTDIHAESVTARPFNLRTPPTLPRAGDSFWPTPQLGSRYQKPNERLQEMARLVTIAYPTASDGTCDDTMAVNRFRDGR